MPVLGWFLGQSVHHFIEAWDHWLAFVLLAWIGGNMLRSGIGGLRENEPVSCPQSDPTAGWNLLLLAVATSIDALAVGLTFAMTNTNAFLPSCLIGVVCAAISACGLFLGKKLSSLPMLNGWAEVLGGVVLLCIGLSAGMPLRFPWRVSSSLPGRPQAPAGWLPSRAKMPYSAGGPETVRAAGMSEIIRHAGVLRGDHDQYLPLS